MKMMIGKTPTRRKHLVSHSCALVFITEKARQVKKWCGKQYSSGSGAAPSRHGVSARHAAIPNALHIRFRLRPAAIPRASDQTQAGGRCDVSDNCRHAPKTR